MFDLTGKVAIVTGGNGGIGKGIALGLAKQGSDVAIVARNKEKSESACKEIQNLGVKAKIDFQPIQPGDVPESFADIDKSTEMLNYMPETDISKGIPQFIDWYKEYHKTH